MATEEAKATGDADFSGYLTKRSMYLKEWRRRYFVLKGNQLHFSKSETVSRRPGAARANAGSPRAVLLHEAPAPSLCAPC